jgi:hypothetical protein
MRTRRFETYLCWFTLCILVIYAPVETLASIRYGLLNPFYVVDLIAMILLLTGALASLRARPHASPALLCAAYGWTAANAWRATFGRIAELESGGQLGYGASEFWAVAIGGAIVLIGFASSLYLVIRNPQAGN